MILKYLRAFCACALLCLALNLAAAQPHRILTINDFQGAPRANGRGVIAYTNCTIDFKYQASRNNGQYRIHANVRMFMNNYKSWIDRSRITSAEQLSEILKHEQGHYTIAYLEQQEVLRAIERTRFSANYQNEAMNIFNRIDAKYKQLNSDYDEDTQHMVNRQQQRSWDIYFAKRLQYMPEENASL
jgi:predicted secreted Zn-dependent protease